MNKKSGKSKQVPVKTRVSKAKPASKAAAKKGPAEAASSRSKQKSTIVRKAAKRGSGNTSSRRSKKSERILDARPDTLDFRDLMFIPTLVEVPSERPLETYLACEIPILDQGKEGACTGFGLATVVNYLLHTRKIVTDKTKVSPKMLYEMAKRYDEWSGEDYDGSSARGAMKGWHKHGVCAEERWKNKKNDRMLTKERGEEARNRPLGAYFRVNHKSLVAMHVAITEVGILYATAFVHEGWQDVQSDGKIKPSPSMIGSHAFAIVGYDRDGFWIQNSWGDKWGKDGFCHLSYDDWLKNGSDVWVARLGVPVDLHTPNGTAAARSGHGKTNEFFAASKLNQHIVMIGNNGKLDPSGTYGKNKDEVANLVFEDFVSVTQNWKKRRILLFAHGGLVTADSAVQRVAEYREALLQHEVYPVSFIWQSDFWTTAKNILQDAFAKRRPEGFLENTKDFILDRLDDTLEPLARAIGGKAQWDEMKENALDATRNKDGGARYFCDALAALSKKSNFGNIEVHVVGHSCGAVFHAPLVQYLATKGKITEGLLKGESGLGVPIETVTLWAPACTTALFKENYLSLIGKNNAIKRFSLFTLDDSTEQDDNCANIYHKSLLYLVSNAFEKNLRNPLPFGPNRDGEALLGMAKFVNSDAEIKKHLVIAKPGKNGNWVLCPNDEPEGSQNASKATEHGQFDDERRTVLATLARILNVDTVTLESKIEFRRSAQSLRERRMAIAEQYRPFATFS